MDYIISIIIPIFNVENYLRAALESIVNQSIGFEKLEVIMVDDCSTDDSGKIMDEYSDKYENFISIHLKENSGTAGKPRNVGLNNSTADYIMFLDSDDEFLPDICETLYETSIKKDADVVSANAFCIQGNNTIVDINYKDAYCEFFPNKDLSLFKPYRVWGTLYRKSLIDKYEMQFIRASTNDDTHFVYNTFLHANKIVYLNEYMGVKYYERDVKEFVSLTHDISKFNFITTIGAFIKICDLIKDSKPNKDYIYDPFISNIFARFNYKWNMCKNDKIEIFEKILEYEKNSNYIINLPFHFKFMNFLLNHKLYTCLILTQKVFSNFIQLKFIQSYLNKKRLVF